MDIAERNQKIRREREQGATYAEIAKQFNVSNELVRKICLKNRRTNIYMEDSEIYILLSSVSDNRRRKSIICTMLGREGIDTVEQLVMMEEEEIQKINGLGSEAMGIIKAALKKVLEERPEIVAIKKINQKLNSVQTAVPSKSDTIRYNKNRNRPVSTLKERRDFEMKNKIGENIRRMRHEKNMTQEELAELFQVSCAAVSKWERGETYPDFEFIIPLANYFEVSVDELMGYNATRMEMEIQEVLETRRKLLAEGKIKESIAVMSEARKVYPSDFRIMHCYMWDVAGGYADNKPEVLLEHKEEFMGICRRIIASCTDDVIRRDAFNMQAKLLHAEEKTGEALEIYQDNFPDWYQTVGQKSEQLFAKDTPEFHNRLICNMLELLAFGMDKKLKEIWHCMDLTLDEKAKHGLALGEAIGELREKIADERLCYVEFKVFSNHVYKVAWLGENDELLANSLEKCLESAKRCDELCREDEIFKNFMSQVNLTKGEEQLLPKWLDFYLHTDIKAYVKMREIPKCAELLKKG